MRQQIQERLDLSSGQQALLENHSLLNLLNILELQLSDLGAELPGIDIRPFTAVCLENLLALDSMALLDRLDEMQQNCEVLRGFLNELLLQHPESGKLLKGLIQTTIVGHSRIEEFRTDRKKWQPMEIAYLKESLRGFLEATSQVSGERFKFRYAPDPPDENAYWIDFRVNIEPSVFKAPLIINDAIRDLVSNARKYSNPGSAIRILLNRIGDEGIQVSVSDEGMGVPEKELQKVIDFGYRATNALDRRTMGGGMGLTKAYWISQYFQGDFFIDSEVGKGTTVELSIYPPLHNGIP